jgi:hypothetical protein
MSLDVEKIQKALESIIKDLDYDLHKSIMNPDDGGPDWYPELADEFSELYNFGE